MSSGLYNGVSGLALGVGLYKGVSGLWSGASGLVTGFGGADPFSGASLYLNMLSGSLDSRVTFTRSTTATFVGSNGLIQSAAVNVPRFGYDPVTLAPLGLLIEETRTNLLLQSETFNSVSWTKVQATDTPNAAVSPSGATTAEKIIVNNGIVLGASTAAGTNQVITKTASAITYTFTGYVKAAEFNSVELFVANSALVSASALCRFNLVTGTAGTPAVGGGFTNASATITPAGNGWYRCSLTATSDTGTGLRCDFWPVDTVATTGNGTSGIFVWGAQVEAGSFATSYIPTVAAPVPRNADIATMTGTNFSSWFNASAGTFFAEWMPSPISGEVIAQISASTNANRFQLINSNAQQISVTAAGVPQGDIDAGTVIAGSVNKLAYGYLTNNTAVSLNGADAVADNTVTLPVVDRLCIGATVIPEAFLNGYIRRIAYFNTRLSDVQLEALAALPPTLSIDFLNDVYEG